MPAGSKVVFLAVKAVLILLAVAVLWVMVAEGYDYLLVGAVDKIAPARIALERQNHSIYFYSGGEPLAGVDGYALHYSLIVTMALILATPRLKLYRRVFFSLMALVFIFLFQLASVFLMANSVNSALGHPSSVSKISLVFQLSTVSVGVLPILIWGILCLRYWLRELRG